MPVLYEVVELANGDIALQREGDDNGQPLVTMRFSTELLRFLRNGKLDIAKVMIEAGMEEVAKLAADFNLENDQAASGKATSEDSKIDSKDEVISGKNADVAKVDNQASLSESASQAIESCGTDSLDFKDERYSKEAPKAELDDRFGHRGDKKRRLSKKVLLKKRRSTQQKDEDFVEAEAISHLIH